MTMSQTKKIKIQKTKSPPSEVQAGCQRDLSSDGDVVPETDWKL